MPNTDQVTLKKAEFLSYWKGLTPADDIDVKPVPYKHKGSTYDQDSIRITGQRDFVDSVLSRLTDVLEYENGTTRLHTTYRQIEDRDTGRLTNSFACYVQVHERGPQAQMANAFVEGVRRATEVDGPEETIEPETNASEHAETNSTGQSDSNELVGDADRAIANQLNRLAQ